MDCTKKDHGCEGGWPWDAIDDMVSLGGLTTEKSYPYKGEQGNCTIKNITTAVKVLGRVLLPKYNETYLKAALNIQPISISVDASSLNFYDKGIFDECSSDPENVDHAIVLIGYGETINDSGNTTKYYKVINSWGKNWGDGGYFYIPQDVNACGITNYPMYVLVE